MNLFLIILNHLIPALQAMKDQVEVEIELEQSQPKEFAQLEAYTIDEVAARVKCNRVTVINLIRSGRLKSFRVGNQYRISETELIRFMGNRPEFKEAS